MSHYMIRKLRKENINIHTNIFLQSMTEYSCPYNPWFCKWSVFLSWYNYLPLLPIWHFFHPWYKHLSRSWFLTQRSDLYFYYWRICALCYHVWIRLLQFSTDINHRIWVSPRASPKDLLHFSLSEKQPNFPIVIWINPHPPPPHQHCYSFLSLLP